MPVEDFTKTTASDWSIHARQPVRGRRFEKVRTQDEKLGPGHILTVNPQFAVK